MPTYLSTLASPTHVSLTRWIAPTRPVLADAGSRPWLRFGLGGIGCGVPALLRALGPSPCRTAAPRPPPNRFGCNTSPNIQVPGRVGFRVKSGTNDHRMVSIGIVEISEKGDQSRWPRI